jgi:hypothetical protein
MTTEKWTELHDELAGLFNRLSIDNYTNTPDFILADLIRDFLEMIVQYNKQNMKWHSWPSLEEKLNK